MKPEPNENTELILAVGPPPTCICGKPLRTTERIEADYDEFGNMLDREIVDVFAMCSDSGCDRGNSKQCRSAAMAYATSCRDFRSSE